MLLETCFVTEDRVKHNFLSIKVTGQERGLAGSWNHSTVQDLSPTEGRGAKLVGQSLLEEDWGAEGGEPGTEEAHTAFFSSTKTKGLRLERNQKTAAFPDGERLTPALFPLR